MNSAGDYLIARRNTESNGNRPHPRFLQLTLAVSRLRTMDQSPMSTWELLKEFGFGESGDGEMVRDFGNLELHASPPGMNRQFALVVAFHGSLFERRSFAFVEFEVPEKIESREQCAAWIAWHLDVYADGNRFVSRLPAPWLEVGRRCSDTLPWERDRIAWEQRDQLYRIRPHCDVDRKWIRLALNAIAEKATKMKDSDLVKIEFRDGILRFQMDGEQLVVSAKGDSWTSIYQIPVGSLRDLPKRLNTDPVTIGVWESSLEIARYRFPGIVEGELPDRQLS